MKKTNWQKDSNAILLGGQIGSEKCYFNKKISSAERYSSENESDVILLFQAIFVAANSYLKAVQIHRLV